MKTFFIDWNLIPYAEAWQRQTEWFDNIVRAKVQGESYENRIVMCEHPHVYTLGRSGKENNMLLSDEQLKAIDATLYHIDRGAKIPFKLILKSLKPILPIVVFTAVLNLFFVSGEGEPLVHIGFLTVYAEGVKYAILMAVRVMALIAGTSLLTYTTSPIVLTDAIEQLLKPLGKLHFPVHELAMMMSIALRFIPTLIEETDKIMNAQKARGAQLDTGKMTERIKALVPVLIPLFISAFRRADELAVAMECRCYCGGDGRTRLKVLRCTRQDYIDLAVCIVCFVVILSSRLVFPNY